MTCSPFFVDRLRLRQINIELISNSVISCELVKQDDMLLYLPCFQSTWDTFMSQSGEILDRPRFSLGQESQIDDSFFSRIINEYNLIQCRECFLNEV